MSDEEIQESELPELPEWARGPTGQITKKGVCIDWGWAAKKMGKHLMKLSKRSGRGVSKGGGKIKK